MSTDNQLLTRFLEHHPEVDYFYLIWIDTVGVSRARVLTKNHLVNLTQSKQKIATIRSIFSRLQDDTPNGTRVNTSAGSVNIVPDLGTLRLAGYSPRSATVLCRFCNSDESSFDLDARSVCQKAIESLNVAGTDLRCGFELEFTLLGAQSGRTKDVSPFDRQWSSARALTQPAVKFLKDVVQALDHSGIQVLQFHAEYGPGQYEVSTAPLPALDALDSYVVSKETVYSIAEQHNLRASFHPKPIADAPGSGAHVHFSISEKLKEEAAIAGILFHLSSICAFSLPTEVSYARVEDSGWAGGRWKAWGSENREVPLRKIAPGHWEFRVIDGTANMYLVLGAIALAAEDGISKNMSLSLRDCSYDPALLTNDQRRELGITERLPQSLSESLRSLELDTELRQGLFKPIVDNFLSSKRAEMDLLKKQGISWYLQWY
ncbi:hypothetical protein LTS08_007117 [Lithohypha guttulata]|uniref:Glutamine synthetase n=1 Tax=Lithohypha guttulata TaxID=1690604 RepID=A0AAN7T1C2_9EURO|nr:hypothetical protein LTR51_005545 [Lithohypha guttulata]KAK5086703.1 hypothetical protein LTR05_003871 [Lithohypha guttulata]KAK5097097.1 hypothetical protein LTS08_007117 [Lithohypha guttulata]